MKLTLLFAIFLSLVSCTIQKRTFNNGYYIEWKSKTPIENKDDKNRILPFSKSVVKSDSLTEYDLTIQESTYQQLDEIILNKKALNNSLISDDTVEMYTYTYKDKTIIASKKDIKTIQKKNRTFKTLAVAGIVVSIFAVNGIFVAITESGIGAILGAFIGLSCGLLAIILLLAALFTYLFYKDLLNKMILKNNAILEGKTIESEEEIEPTVEPNPHSKRNALVFLGIILSTIIGYLIFKNV